MSKVWVLKDFKNEEESYRMQGEIYQLLIKVGEDREWKINNLFNFIHSRMSYQFRRLTAFAALFKLKCTWKAANAKEHLEERGVTEVMWFLKTMIPVKSLIKRECNYSFTHPKSLPKYFVSNKCENCPTIITEWKKL